MLWFSSYTTKVDSHWRQSTSQISVTSDTHSLPHCSITCSNCCPSCQGGGKATHTHLFTPFPCHFSDNIWSFVYNHRISTRYWLMSERYLYSHFIRVRGNLSTNCSRYINYQSDLFCELILGLKILGVENTVSDFGAIHLAFQTYTNLLINLNQTTEKTPTFGFIYTYPRLSKFHYQFELLASSSWSRLNRGPTDLLLPSSITSPPFRHFCRSPYRSAKTICDTRQLRLYINIVSTTASYRKVYTNWYSEWNY